MNGAAATHNDFDLFVIRAGSSGVRAAQIAAGHGASVAVAEEYRVGGTCVIRGCVPKKLLIYGAHFAEDLKDAWRFGWNVPDCDFDWTELRDNVLADVDRVEKKNGKLSVLIKDGDSLDCDLLLFTTGRRPRSERLGLGMSESIRTTKAPSGSMNIIAPRWRASMPWMM